MLTGKSEALPNDGGDMLAELQSLGVQVDEGSHALSIRRGGAGPSDHMPLSLGEATVMVPVLSRGARSSPYRLRLVGEAGQEPQVVLERDARFVATAKTR